MDKEVVKSLFSSEGVKNTAAVLALVGVVAGGFAVKAAVSGETADVSGITQQYTGESR